MDFQIKSYQGTLDEDKEITCLLETVFVNDGYTDRSRAKKMFVSGELQKRGEIILARSSTGDLLGMIIYVRPTSPACQIANMDESEIHLLAVLPKARNRGIGTHLILACEKRAVSFGYSRMVLSTQQTMKSAHHVYEKLGYYRNPMRDWSNDTGRAYLVYEKPLSLESS